MITEIFNNTSKKATVWGIDLLEYWIILFVVVGDLENTTEWIRVCINENYK